MSKLSATVNRKKYKLLYTDTYDVVMGRADYLNRRWGKDMAKVVQVGVGKYSLYVLKKEREKY